MQRIAEFEREGAAMVWRRRTSGCAAAFGWLTALFGLLWGGGGLAGALRTGEPLAIGFAFGGACTFLFGLVFATIRSEVRIDGDTAVIRRSVVVPIQEIRVPVRVCSSVAATRSLVALPRAPRSIGPHRYAPAVSVGLVTPQGFVALATEFEDGGSEASVGAAIEALRAVTRLPAQDLRTSASVLLAELRAWRVRSLGVAVLVAVVILGAVAIAGAVAVSMLQPPSDAPNEPERPRGRRRHAAAPAIEIRRPG